jgi:hypothetical protein
MPVKLHFDGKAVAELIAHAKAAPEHRPLYGDQATAKPGLWLVGDDGVYLMSNGLPPLPGNGAKPNRVVKARECDPEKVDFEDWWSMKADTFGEDDGCEFLPLDHIEEAFAAWADSEIPLGFSEKGLHLYTPVLRRREGAQ